MKNLEREFISNVIMPTKKMTEQANFLLPAIIKEHIFNGEGEFISKRYTNFYALVLKK